MFSSDGNIKTLQAMINVLLMATIVVPQGTIIGAVSAREDPEDFELINDIPDYDLTDEELSMIVEEVDPVMASQKAI